MKICMASSPFLDILDEIRFAAFHKFDGIEISIEHPNSTPEHLNKRIEDILGLLSSYPLVRLAHTPIFINICDAYDTVREASLKELLKALEVAYLLEIKFLTVHPGYLRPNITKETAIRNLISSLEALLSKADNLGITLGLENLPPPPLGYFTEPGDFKSLFQQFNTDRLKLVFDFAHANIGGSTSPFIFIEQLFDKLGHIHLSDNFGDRDSHLPLGAGKVKYEELIARLRGKGYDGTLTLEVFSDDREHLLLSKRKVEALTSSQI
ncbi:MAG: sugar phosphate isomerase/epimerase family protein [Candidatus Bathyarchaeia archaeon]